MTRFESLQTDRAMRRLVLARVAAAAIFITAVVLAPPVTDSIVSLESSRELAERLDDGEPVPTRGIDAEQTTAAAVEPLTSSY